MINWSTGNDFLNHLSMEQLVWCKELQLYSSSTFNLHECLSAKFNARTNKGLNLLNLFFDSAWNPNPTTEWNQTKVLKLIFITHCISLYQLYTLWFVSYNPNDECIAYIICCTHCRSRTVKLLSSVLFGPFCKCHFIPSNNVFVTKLRKDAFVDWCLKEINYDRGYSWRRNLKSFCKRPRQIVFIS